MKYCLLFFSGYFFNWVQLDLNMISYRYWFSFIQMIIKIPENFKHLYQFISNSWLVRFYLFDIWCSCFKWKYTFFKLMCKNYESFIERGCTFLINIIASCVFFILNNTFKFHGYDLYCIDRKGKLSLTRKNKETDANKIHAAVSTLNIVYTNTVMWCYVLLFDTIKY